MSYLLAIITAVLNALIPAIATASKDTMEDSASNTASSKILRDRVCKTWGPKTMTTAGSLILCMTLTGCFTRTIYVPHGEPVRLRATIENAKVWVMDANGKTVEGTMDLPEGWYSLPMDQEAK